jgi:hypothetical protein
MSAYAVSPHAACASVDGGAVLLHMETKRYYSLNETGALIWRLLQQRTEPAEILRRIVATYSVGLAEAERAFARLLGELRAESLVTVDGE